MKKSAALGISRSGGARNPRVFQYTLVAALRRNATSLRSRRFFRKALSPNAERIRELPRRFYSRVFAKNPTIDSALDIVDAASAQDLHDGSWLDAFGDRVPIISS